MKTRILSLAIALIALFAFTNAYAQNPHYVEEPCKDKVNRTIEFKAAGLGSGPIRVVVTGEYVCINPGGNLPPAWQDFELDRTIRKGTGGNYDVVLQLTDLCRKRNWDFDVQNVRIQVFIPGESMPVLDDTYEQLPECE